MTRTWTAYICDLCGSHSEHLAPPNTDLPRDWYEERDVDEYGSLIYCPSCKPTKEPSDG